MSRVIIPVYTNEHEQHEITDDVFMITLYSVMITLLDHHMLMIKVIMVVGRMITL